MRLRRIFCYGSAFGQARPTCAAISRLSGVLFSASPAKDVHPHTSQLLRSLTEKRQASHRTKYMMPKANLRTRPYFP